MSATPRTGDNTYGETTAIPVQSDAADGQARVGPFSPTVLVIAATTALGLAARGFLLTRHGFLTSGTVEYDDGVYLGAAIRLLQGTLPYRDFAFVQPPGILIVALPFALVARLASTAAGLAVARVVTVCASAACVPLAGNLVRHRGTVATLVTCGFLAVYPVDVVTARTLLLEPWMNLCCLLAVNAAFRHGRLASTRRLAWAGALLGFAASIKIWAAIPAVALLAWCLLERGQRGRREQRGRRAGVYLGGVAVGFALPVAPFAASAPVAFFRSTVLDQATRTGATVPLSERLAYLTGLIDFIGRHGKLVPDARGGSAFAAASNGTMLAAHAGWLPFACAGLAVVILAAAYLRRPGDRSQLEWFAVVVAAASCTAISAYSAFFYHYPAFPAPWLAIAFGAAADAAAAMAARRLRRTLPAGSARRATRLTALAAVAVVILAVAVVQSRQLAGKTAPPSPPAVAAIVPAGACLVTDQISFALAADRFPPSDSGCPDILDSMGVTLVLGDGASVQGGAGKMPQVMAGWRSIFGHAQYVWLSQGFQQRIPWTPGLREWFSARFRLVRTFRGYGDSALYVQKS
jgi:alpha-1,2-mannosyltransferase